jgi:hypothetical protein
MDDLSMLTGLYVMLGFFIGITITAVGYYMYQVQKARHDYELSLDDAQYRKYHEFLHLSKVD